ncbi:MAG: hypothetical protein FWD59_02530 [Micrococcales bacterium]|nr:hypothetical protein [Micrococcales bacterium]
MTSRNVTLSLDPLVARRARIMAAERDISLSALVTGLINAAPDSPPGYDEVWNEELRAMREGVGLSVGEITWTREDLHRR